MAHLSGVKVTGQVVRAIGPKQGWSLSLVPLDSVQCRKGMAPKVWRWRCPTAGSKAGRLRCQRSGEPKRKLGQTPLVARIFRPEARDAG